MNAAPDTNDTVLTLPRQTGSHAVAQACRDTMVDFLNESQHWGKAELAMWLMGPYAQVARYGADVAARSGERSVPLLRDIDAHAVARTIRAARAEAFGVLADLGDADALMKLTTHMIDSGFVAACEDENGVTGYVPTSNARRLGDRVLSLIVADLLTRPWDYETLAVCGHCQSVDFDARFRARGVCSRHESGFFGPENPRGSRCDTFPSVPEPA